MRASAAGEPVPVPVEAEAEGDGGLPSVVGVAVAPGAVEAVALGAVVDGLGAFDEGPAPGPPGSAA
ncbi:hypothetical protein GCM10010230_62580 [Streptomyces narbonensis]|nr:hypothetical protein GCM10010230_62580 [Streptomyces narbonensis]